MRQGRRKGSQYHRDEPVRSRFEEFGTTTNRPHNLRSHLTTPAQDLYIKIIHFNDRLRTATPTADKTVGLINRRISPQQISPRVAPGID